MTPIETVLVRLEACENSPGRWRAACPVCGGRNRSTLSIGAGETGAVLLHCFKSECRPDQIAAALGLELADLFPSRQGAGQGGPPIKRRRLLPAHQALQLLEKEMHLAVVCMSDMAMGLMPDDATRDRLLTGAARVALLRDEVAA